MAFPNFFGKQYESASNFLDDLEMAFLVSGRDEKEVKLRAFPLVLKDSAKNWFQNLEPERKTNWETLKETFLSKYGGLDNPEHLWHRISSLHQATSRTYLTYESQFLRLWAEWEASLAEGERAPNFLKKEKFLAELFSDLQEKVKGKFPETFEEALQIARVKDRKLEYQAHTSRVEHPQGPTMADERLPPAPTTTPEDPHLELLQRVTNQLDNLSINMVQGVRQQQPQPNNERMPNGPRRQPQRRDYFCYNCGEVGHGMYFCPHPRNFNAQAGRGRQQVSPPRARPPPQIQPQILQNPQMVAQPQVLQHSVAPQPVAEIPPLPNNNERKNRSLMEKARCMLKAKSLPHKLRMEAVACAAHVLNRCPTEALKTITPYEAWYDRKPSASYLRVFCCLAYAHIPQQLCGTLDDKAIKYIFVGYSVGSKGYRLYNPATNKIFESRDEFFAETTAQPMVAFDVPHMQTQDVFEGLLPSFVENQETQQVDNLDQSFDQHVTPHDVEEIVCEEQEVLREERTLSTWVQKPLQDSKLDAPLPRKTRASTTFGRASRFGLL
ncbi:hypothetical protein L7F22_022877 [Adiantum nelumboides]|nr:hypothetical protein [Adiantum nelumboides]